MPATFAWQQSLRVVASVMLVFALALSRPAASSELLVFAAASLKPALDELLAQPSAQAIGNIRASYAASSQLARQINHGAPAVLFISADQDWMDHLATAGRIVPDTRGDLLGNALVLVAVADSPTNVRLSSDADIATALGKDGRLAVAEPNSVPAGKYAKAALTSLGLWASVRDRLVAADSVRSALNFVVRGEAPLGIVYRSDARSEPLVRIVDTFPESSHVAIRYPVAIVAGHDSAAARQLLLLLRGADSAALFRRHGFDAPAR